MIDYANSSIIHNLITTRRCCGGGSFPRFCTCRLCK